MEKKYVRDINLKNQIDWKNIMKMDRYSGSHDGQMQGLIKDAKVIGHWSDNGYQGEVATAIELPDGRYAIYTTYYDSDGGGDGWGSESDEDITVMGILLAEDALIFKSLKDLRDFLSEPSIETSWNSGIAKKLLSDINKRN